MTYTVQWFNGATKNHGAEGTFPTLEEAKAFMIMKSMRSRPFMTYQVWKGKPRNLIDPVGEPMKGIA